MRAPPAITDRVPPGAARAAGEGGDLVRKVVRAIGRNDLPSYASAIAFQALFALVPAALAAVALLGFFDVEGLWTDDLRPELQERLSADAFSVIDRSVEGILEERQGLWLTFGLAFALWQVSGAVRAAMHPLNLIYGEQEERGVIRRFAVSLGLAVVVGPGLLLAALAVHLGPRLVARIDAPLASVGLSVARWGLAVVVLYGVVWLVLRHAPARRHALRWSSLGGLIVIGAWLGTSLVFGWYVTTVADYESIYGGLASVIVLLTYLYASATALLIGAQVDACIRERARDGADGEPGRPDGR